MRHLPHDAIIALHKAAVDAGLARADLLRSIHPAFAASLPGGGTPAAQILSDLHTFNTIEALTDESVPLRQWLTDAVTLAGVRPEAAVFERTLERLGWSEKAVPAAKSGPKVGRGHRGAQLDELVKALLSAFPSRNQLAQLLLFKLDKKLDEIASQSGLRDTVFEVLKASESEGWTSELLEAAILQAPNNQALRAVAAKWST